MLVSQGAEVISMPMIKTSALSIKMEKKLESYDWLIFTSKNAVESFCSQIQPIKNKIAAIGQQTAKKLQQHQLEPVFTGSGKSSEEFASELLGVVKSEEHILLILGNLAPNTLEEALANHAQIERINIYKTEGAGQIDKRISNKIRTNQYDAITFTSPSAYTQLIKNIDFEEQHLKAFSIGQTTTSAMLENQHKPLATAKESTYCGLANTIIDYYQKI